MIRERFSLIKAVASTFIELTHEEDLPFFIETGKSYPDMFGGMWIDILVTCANGEKDNLTNTIERAKKMTCQAFALS